MMLDMYGLREKEMSFQAEVEFILPFMERVMMGDIPSFYEIKKEYETILGNRVRKAEICQLLYRHNYWNLIEQYNGLQ
jgi:hypothetical protein